VKAAAPIAMAVVLLLSAACPAGAKIFGFSAVISFVRDRSAEFGYETSAYSDEEIRDFLDTIPEHEMKAFVESYSRRPDEGTEMTARLKEINRIEFEREKKLIGRWITAWKKGRSERRPVRARQAVPADLFAFND